MGFSTALVVNRGFVRGRLALYSTIKFRGRAQHTSNEGSSFSMEKWNIIYNRMFSDIQVDALGTTKQKSTLVGRREGKYHLRRMSTHASNELSTNCERNFNDEWISSIFDESKMTSFEGNNVKDALKSLAMADAVCFDVDSTVIQEEGIDVLADSLGKGEQVAAWTARAMNGNVKFEDALAARLDIIRPSRNDIKKCIANHPFQLTPGIDGLISALHQRGTDVYLVSGGFRVMIEPIAKVLGVRRKHIVANTILFSDSGEYYGFDPMEPTSADKGKPKALTQIKNRGEYHIMVMVGDGATDSQAKPPADAFIGFGGVVVRETVRQNACWFVRDFDDMTTIVTRSQELSDNWKSNKL